MTQISKSYLWFASVTLAFAIVLIVMGLSKNPTLVFSGALILGALIIHLVLSLHQVNQDEKGVILLFGKPIVNVESGFHPLPWPMSILTFKRTAIQRQYPGEPSMVFQGHDDAEMQAGMIRPIRITHPAAVSSSGKKTTEADPLTRRMTTSIFLVASFWIDDPKTFVEVIGTIENALRHIEDVMTRTAQQVMSQKTVAECLADMDGISTKIREATEKLVETWGVTLRDAYLERILTSKEVSAEMRNVASEELRRQSTLIKADADKYAKERAAEADAFAIEKKGVATASAEALLIEKKGIATAEARLAFLTKEAGGLKKLAKDLNIKEGELLVALETIKTALQTSNHTIIAGTDGLANLAGLATAVNRVLSNPVNPASGQPKTNP